MEQKAAKPKHALELLPIEAKQAIMSTLPDVWSLKSIAMTCSSMYHAFAEAEVLITSRVLLNEVEFDVFPEATAALESSRIKPWTRQRIQDFVFQHLHSRGPPLQSWKLSDALPISRLYSHIRYFAADLASKALAKSPISTYLKHDQAPLSRNEITRIIRAFFRFEIYCNIFRDPKRTLFNIQEQRDIFFSNFSPWENEQLACIHDYLFRVVSPAFNDIAEHDIAWGEFSVEYGDRIDSEFIQHLLSLGLAHLHRIVLAETYEARHKLLYSNYPPDNSEFLYEGLKTANEHDDGVYLSDYTQDEELAHIKSPFVPDSDTGPTYAWRWAHQDETCAHFLNSDSEKPLREWGYVMWDRARLDKWDTFQMPWEAPDTSAPTDQETQRVAEMRASFHRRSKIYMAGGRGWWSLGDESKIVWPGKKNPRDNRTRGKGYRQVKSLSEARGFLTSLSIP